MTTTPGARRWRIGLWFALLLSWLVLLPMLWTAFSTLPSLDRLSQPRMVQIPTLRTVGLLAAQSAAEVGVVLVLLFPWRPRRYLTRLWLSALGVATWFIATTPLGLTRMSWIHRRWLALVGLALAVSALIGTVARVLPGARSHEDRPPPTSRA